MMRATLVGAAVLVMAGVSTGGARQPGGSAVVSGELRQWHKVTLTFNGPQASETDSSPNPFTDYRMTVVFTHESGTPRYEVPGYFPFWDMTNADGLVGNHTNDNSVFCFAKAGDVYLVYLPSGGSADLDLTGASGQFSVRWFDPRTGGALKRGSVAAVKGGGKVPLGAAPGSPDEDWLVVLRR